MSFTVIHDAEKEVAALVDAEFGRALGPIASGEKAVELLGKFAAAHGVDPATIPTPELESRWKDFVSALTAEVKDGEDEVHHVADEILHPGVAPAGEAADPTLAGAPSAASVAAGTSEGTDRPAPEGEQIPGQSPIETDPARPTPVTEPKGSNVVCPTCDGWREIAPGGVVQTCPTCHGEGEIPAHEDVAAQQQA